MFSTHSIRRTALALSLVVGLPLLQTRQADLAADTVHLKNGWVYRNVKVVHQGQGGLLLVFGNGRTLLLDSSRIKRIRLQSVKWPRRRTKAELERLIEAEVQRRLRRRGTVAPARGRKTIRKALRQDAPKRGRIVTRIGGMHWDSFLVRGLFGLMHSRKNNNLNADRNIVAPVKTSFNAGFAEAELYLRALGRAEISIGATGGGQRESSTGMRVDSDSLYYERRGIASGDQLIKARRLYAKYAHRFPLLSVLGARAGARVVEDQARTSGLILGLYPARNKFTGATNMTTAPVIQRLRSRHAAVTAFAGLDLDVPVSEYFQFWLKLDAHRGEGRGSWGDGGSLAFMPNYFATTTTLIPMYRDLRKKMWTEVRGASAELGFRVKSGSSSTFGLFARYDYMNVRYRRIRTLPGPLVIVSTLLPSGEAEEKLFLDRNDAGPFPDGRDAAGFVGFEVTFTF